MIADSAVPVRLTDQLDAHARQVSGASTAWMDGLWDADQNLLRYPLRTMDGHPVPEEARAVRETCWYAIGLLARDGAGDAARACQAIEAVLEQQWDQPGAVFDGTWRRTPQEPTPGEDAVLWEDYDPNWREFIGCALLLALHDFADRLPAALIARIDRALKLAARGAQARAVSPLYSNIALMSAFLLHAVGERRGEPAMAQAGVELGRQVHAVWARTGTFTEFNSPTYYGVDLFALAQWRRCAGSAELRALATDMEDGLWQEIATRYHPGLRTMAGPFDRAYGMDLRAYISLIGQWIALVVGPELAPVPAVGAAAHAHDYCFAPCAALLGVPASADQIAVLPSIVEPRFVSTVITDSPRRVATTWMGPRHMVGAEDAGATKPAVLDQYHPVTVHWLLPGSDQVGWVRVASQTVVDGRVDRDGALHLTYRDSGEPLVFEVCAPGPDDALTAERWPLPGLTVTVHASTGMRVTATRTGDVVSLAYRPLAAPDGPIRLDLNLG